MEEAACKTLNMADKAVRALPRIEIDLNDLDPELSRKHCCKRHPYTTSLNHQHATQSSVKCQILNPEVPRTP